MKNKTNQSVGVQSQMVKFEKIRSDFVANVSHELRTPLTVIRGYLEALLDSPDQPKQELLKIFEQMHQHSARMEAIIEDLLLLSSLETQQEMDHVDEQVDVSSLLAMVVDEARVYSGEKSHQITLEVDSTLKLLAESHALKSLFSNLIINAVKYTPKNGDIHVCWFVCDGAAVFEVKDTGIGIAAKHIPRLTERFYRVDKARSRSSGGTGLGLAIVKHVLIRYQAFLEVESDLEKGSLFRCIFPAERIFCERHAK